MLGHSLHFLTGCLAPRPSREMREIFMSTAIRSLAVAAVGIFEPVYLYSLGLSVPVILLFFALTFLGYLLLLPLGGRVCRRHGYEHTMLFSSPFLIVHYMALLAVPISPVFLGMSVVARSIYSTLYWPGFHSNFASSSRDGELGREVSNSAAITSVAAALAPAVAAAVIVTLGFKVLFIFAAVLVLLSNVPMLRTPEVFMPRDFPYLQPFGKLVREFLHPRVLAYFGLAEQVVAAVVWPVFLAVSLSGVVAVGAVIALARLVNVLVTLYVGRLSDEERQAALLRSGAVFTLTSWLVRPLVVGPLGMFLIDSYYQVSRNMTAVPFSAIMYGHTRHDDIVSAVVLNEMSITVGRVAICLILAAVFAWSPLNPWYVSFVVAAGFSAFYTLLPALGRQGTGRSGAGASVRDPNVI
ncbi:MAG: MFS transporter [bacterium]